MPRPNKPRAIAAEDHLARRVAFERESRGWTYESLAKRMTDAGCPINASALYKVEKGNPRRRITYAEAVALAQVLDVPLSDLGTPPELVAEREVVAALDRWSQASAALGAASANEEDARTRLRDLLLTHPTSLPAAARYLGAYVTDKWAYTGEQREEGVEYLLLTLRGLPRDHPEWRAHQDKYASLKKGASRGQHR